MSDNIMIVLTVLIYIGAILGMFLNYGSFAATVVKWSKKPVRLKSGKYTQPQLTQSELVRCYIPIVQVCSIRKALYYKDVPFFGISVVALVGIIINLLNKFLIPINSYVMLVTSYIMIVSLLVTFIVYAIVTVDCARMYDVPFSTLLLLVIAPCVFCTFVKPRVSNKMREIHKEEIFNGTDENITIKQRYNE